MKNKIWKILASIFVITAILPNTFKTEYVEAAPMGQVIVDEGTVDEITIGEDITGTDEAVVPAGYVQSTGHVLNFEIDNLEGLSSEVAILINNSIPLDDGSMMSLVTEYNYQSSVMNSVDRIVRGYILHVGADGVVIKSKAVTSNGSASSGLGAWDTNYTYDADKYSSDGRLIENSSGGYSVLYNGFDGSRSIKVIANFDSDLNFISENELSVSSPWAHNYNIWSGSEYTQRDIFVNYSVWNSLSTDKMTNSVIDVENAIVASTFDMDLPKFDDFNDWSSAPVNNSRYRQHSSIYELPSGEKFGLVNAGAYLNDGTPYTINVHSLVLWNNDNTIKNSYILQGDSDKSRSIVLYDGISTEREIIFYEHYTGKLQKMNVNTWTVETLKEFPIGTNITITKSDSTLAEEKYEFSGYIPSSTGEFEGYTSDGSGGVAIGTMDEEFSVNSMAVVPASGVTMNIIGSSDTSLQVRGNLGTNRTFANEPTTSTNSIDGQGWIDKSTDTLSNKNTNDIYFGSMLKIDDYAPALNVGDTVKVNKDDMASWDTTLTSSVEVYDTFDLSPDNPANRGLTNDQMLDKLTARINRNPNNLTNDIDWEGLGLNKDEVGYNPQVKFFITDSNKQMTQDSKAVNVVANSTVIDPNNKVALDASNFSINLGDNDSLTLDDAKTRASVSSWDMTDGTDLYSGVIADGDELEAIQKATEPGIFDLTFGIEHNGVRVTNTIKVYVVGATAPITNVAVFGDNFEVDLADAASYPSVSGYMATNSIVYDIATGSVIADSNITDSINYPTITHNNQYITVDVANINNATTIGPVDVEISYNDGTQTGATTVVANIIDDSVDKNGDEYIAARDFILLTSEVSGLTDTIVKDKASAYAWNGKTKDELTLSADYTAIEAKEGIYDVTFTTENGTTKTVKAYVFDRYVQVGNEVITADDFAVELSEVSSLTDDKIIDLADAYAIDFNTGADIPVTIHANDIVEAIGSYDVTFTTANGTMITIRATVGNNVVVNNGKAISAADVIMTEEEVAAFNEDRDLFDDDLVVRSGAAAWMVSNNASLTPIDVDSTTINIADITPYTYEVTYSHDASVPGNIDVISTKANVTIKGKNTVINPVHNEAIDANDFALLASEVSGLTDEKVIELAGARAWDTNTIADVDITSVDFSAIEAKQGVYDVTFTTANGTLTTIQAFVGVKNRPIIIEDLGIVIFADDYTVNKKDLDDMTIADHIKMANAYAIDQDTYDPIDISHINLDKVVKRAGVYGAQFGVDTDNHTTVNVTVIDDSLPTTGGTTYVLIFALMTLLITSYKLVRKNSK